MASKVKARPASKRATSRSSRGHRSGSAVKRLGCQTPRIFTPPLRPLTPETSLGFEVIEFADWIRDRLEELDAKRTPDDDTDYLGLFPRLLEWQRWLLIHALELLPGSTSVPRFRTVLLLVARQNGKSTVLTALVMWHLFQIGSPMVLETHASIDHARKAWEEAVAIAEAIPELANEIAKVNEGKGSELLRLDGGEKFKIATANRRGGRGFSGDFIIFDELREHQDWRAWSATSKTSLARRRAQIWGVSNAGDTTAVVLRHLRKIALASIKGEPIEGVPEELIEDLDLDTMGLFEWSAQDGEDGTVRRGVWDREGWAEANPSMGYTELDERAIAAAALSDPEWEFRTEVLCQFVNMVGVGPFPTGSWSKTFELKVKRDKARPATYCVDLSHDRTMAYIAIAYWDTKGRVRAEIAAQRAGVEWIIPWLQSSDRKVTPDFVTMQSRGAPITSMTDEFEKAKITLQPWEGIDLAGWHGATYDLLRRAVADDAGGDESEIVFTHGAQPSLDLAANSAAVKAIGDGWVIDRKNSPEDAAPLLAMIGAVGLLKTNPKPPTVSVYETRGLMVV